MSAIGQQSESNRGATDGVFVWGDIVDPDLIVDLVGFLQQSRRSAVLTVAHGERRKSVYFRQGAIMAASSSSIEDRFGNIMFRRGLISRAQLDEAVAEVRPGKKIGNILMGKGLISGEDLWKILKVQIEEILYSVLLVEEGEFTLAEYDDSQVPTRTALDTQHVLLEGLRRKDEMRHLADQLPALEVPLLRAGDAAAELKMDPRENTIYAMVNGKRTVGELLKTCGLGAFAATHALHRLLKSGLIKPTPPPMSPTSDLERRSLDIIDAYNDAFEKIATALNASPEPAPKPSAGISTFFVDVGGPLQALFEDVTIANDGRLDARTLAENLRASTAKRRNHLLNWGLRDYLRYLLFTARERLPYDQVEGLAAQVSKLVDSH